MENKIVTILILVETPLQLNRQKLILITHYCHNPYFSGNSFTTKRFVLKFVIDHVTILILVETPLQQNIMFVSFFK